MTTKPKAPKAPLTLDQLREAAALASSRGYGAVAAYAAALNATEGFTPGWYDEKKSVGVVELERTAYIELLKAKGHGNPYESWRQVKNEARKAAAKAAAAAAKAAADAGEESAEGKAAAEPDDATKLSTWALEQLAKMIKKIEKADAVNFSAVLVLKDLKAAQARISAPISGPAAE